MKRTATAVWNGSGKEGKGTLTTQSKTLNNTQYSFTSRFESGTGTNPEELIAAAHAGCFNMAFSFMLGGEGFEPKSINTIATLTMENKGTSWTVTAIHLDVNAKIPEITAATFSKIAENAKANCPISRLLNASITMNAKLEN
jgi:osmotically inducible protein OsmC